MALGRFLTPTSFRPSRVLSNRTNTTNASSSCCIPVGTSASPSITPWCGQVFGGPGFRNGSLTCINLHHCLACRRCCGDTSFVSSLSHQFVTSPQARVLHHQAIRRPLVSCIVSMQPSGPPPSSLPPVACVLSERLRRVGPDTGTALSSCPRPCIAARYRFERQAWFQPFQSASPMHSVPSSPNPGARRRWEWSRRAGVAVSLSEARSLPRAFARGYDHPRSVACRTSTVRCMRLPQSTTG